MTSALARFFVRGWGRLLGRFTDSSARTPGEPAGAWDPEDYRGRSYCLLVSYRRDGRPVPTPLWFAHVGDRLLFRTDAESPKVARMRREPGVLVAPCDIRGRPLGPAVEMTAVRVTDPSNELEIERAIGCAYGLAGRIWNVLVRASQVEAACFELIPRPPAGPRAG